MVARPSSIPMLTTSVAVVRKMLEAVAGSKPKRFNVSGTIAPEMPLAEAAPRVGVGAAAAGAGAVREAGPGFLGHQATLGAGLELAQRHAAQRHGERLAAG